MSYAPGSDLIKSPARLLQRCAYGFAAFLTGGIALLPYVVTTLADTGAGSLRTALTDPTVGWITFTPGLSGTIVFNTVVNAIGNKTIDGQLANITIDNAAGLIFTGQANIIFAYVTVTNLTGTNNSADGITFVNCDKVYLLHVTAKDAHDSCFDFTGWADGATFGGCRVTVDSCRIGPNPGHHQLVDLGRVSGPHGNLNGTPNGATPDVPSKGLITYRYCLWEGLRDRGPFADSCFMHVYNSAHRKWGDVNGGGYAVECGPDPAQGSYTNFSQLLIENDCFDPYTLNEPHIVSGAPVVNPDLEAVLRRGVGPLINSHGHYKKNGSAEGLSVSQGPVNGTATHAVTPEVFNDAVFTPSYAYTLETANEALLTRLRARSGNVQPAIGLLAA